MSAVPGRSKAVVELRCMEMLSVDSSVPFPGLPRLLWRGFGPTYNVRSPYMIAWGRLGTRLMITNLGIGETEVPVKDGREGGEEGSDGGVEG